MSHSFTGLDGKRTEIGRACTTGLNSIYNGLTTERHLRIRQSVELANSVLDRHHYLALSGKLTHAAAKAIADIQAMRYDGNNYFWITDDVDTLLMPPFQTQDIGNGMLNGRDTDRGQLSTTAAHRSIRHSPRLGAKAVDLSDTQTRPPIQQGNIPCGCGFP